MTSSKVVVAFSVWLVVMMTSTIVVASSYSEFAHVASQVNVSGGMLEVQQSESREVLDLSGVWTFRTDSAGAGFDEKWFETGLPQPTIPMPVPASFNDITQNETLRMYLGWVWYEVDFWVPKSWVNGVENTRIVLRFESVHYNAIAWVNGVQVASHSGGHLPFEGILSEGTNSNVLVTSKYPNKLVVAVNNTLTMSTLPPGLYTTFDDDMHPPGYAILTTYFDFFNYAGIDRRVFLYTTPATVWVDDITINTNITSSGDGVVSFDVSVLPAPASNLTISLIDANGNVVASIYDNANSEFVIPADTVQLWQPGNAYLYTLEIIASASSGEYDVYRLGSVGIRTIGVTSTQFLINNSPFYFHGVDRHEDSDIRGKGWDNPLIIKDFNLMNWLGVNAFRTSHYPYATDYYDWADKQGMVIIGEATAVGLNIAEFFNNGTLAHHLQVMAEMIRRDKNHPSVVMWNMANEPNTNPSQVPNANEYFKVVSEFTRSIDPTFRPITIVQDMDYNTEGGVTNYVDVTCINRYYAWYSDPGAIQLIPYQLSFDLNAWYSKYPKPIIMSEYGADTVTGIHLDPSEMFSEEFQLDFMSQYWSVFDQFRSKFLIGELVWNFADFKTGESDIRVGSLNRKGIFTRERQPKMVARFLQGRYLSLKSEYGN